MEPANAALDIVLLRTFLEVVDAGGFALAGERLALTPSAVSGHIRRLEQAAGTGLLLRTTRSFRLTPAGELLYAYARNIVSLDQEVRARLRNAPAEEHLRIGASEDPPARGCRRSCRHSADETRVRRCNCAWA